MSRRVSGSEYSVTHAGSGSVHDHTKARQRLQLYEYTRPSWSAAHSLCFGCKGKRSKEKRRLANKHTNCRAAPNALVRFVFTFGL
jgi:hypothetical protein